MKNKFLKIVLCTFLCLTVASTSVFAEGEGAEAAEAEVVDPNEVAKAELKALFNSVYDTVKLNFEARYNQFVDNVNANLKAKVDKFMNNVSIPKFSFDFSILDGQLTNKGELDVDLADIEVATSLKDTQLVKVGTAKVVYQYDDGNNYVPTVTIDFSKVEGGEKSYIDNITIPGKNTTYTLDGSKLTIYLNDNEDAEKELVINAELKDKLGNVGDYKTTVKYVLLLNNAEVDGAE